MNNANANTRRHQEPIDILQLSFFRRGGTPIENQQHADKIAQDLIGIAGDTALNIFGTSLPIKTQTLQVRQRSQFESFSVNQKSVDIFTEYMNVAIAEDQSTCANYPNMYDDDTTGALYVARRGNSAMASNKTSVNCVYCIDDNTDTFIKIQMKDTQDPMINEVINAICVADSDAFLQYESHCLIPYWNQGTYCKTLQLKPVLRPEDGWKTLSECRKSIITNQGWTKRNNDALLVEIDRIIGVWKEKRVEHNDLHLNNVFYNTVSGKMKIIDYGRMWIPRDRIPMALVDDCKQKYGMKDSEDAVLDKIYSDSGLLMWQMRDPQIGHMCDMVALLYNVVRVMKDVPWPRWFVANSSNITYQTSGVYAYMLEKKRNSCCNAWDAMAFFALCCHALQRYVWKRQSIVSFPEDDLDAWQTLSCKDFVDHVMYPNRIVSPSKFAPIGAIVKQILNARDGYDIVWASQGGRGNVAVRPTMKHNRNVWNVTMPTTNVKSRNAHVPKADKELDEDFCESIPFVDKVVAYTFDPQRHYYLTPSDAKLIKDAIARSLKQQIGAEKTKRQTKRKEYRLYTDVQKNHQKYIRRSKKKWYLCEHRGQYRYTTKSKTHVYIF